MTLRSRFTLEEVKNLVQIVALGLAACYFTYTWAIGRFWVSVSLDIETSRVHDPANAKKDIIAISMSVKNGGQMSLRIHDAAVKITYDTMVCTQRLEGITRYAVEDHRLLLTTPHPTILEAGLGSGQQTEFGTWVRVPRNVACKIEGGVLVKQRWNWSYPQSLVSGVSLPVGDS